ncbi:hypothetical protein [Lentibacillus jeotgali]|uniref:hypothetical protein n=1 Tax=Lentibacillus jeotgali TaxID=558169 RepID=UPI0002626032|nr:hypothetical protein [Lentibacillus jeotgali]
MNENIIAKILFIIGIAQMAAGLIIGIIAVSANYYMVSWSVFFAWTGGGFVIGMLFIGFAENIRLLNSINEKNALLKASPKQVQHNAESNVRDPQPEWTLEEDEKAKIRETYQDETIVEIVPAPRENYCLVRLQRGDEFYVRVVYVGEFGAQETEDAGIRQSVIQWYNEKN